MENTKITVRPTSSNFAWGIYGFCEKVLWEDIEIYNEKGERIAGTCINSKMYIREGLPELEENPENLSFAKSVKKFLTDNSCHYWYYYDREGRDSEDFYEVPYWGPKNEAGIKPRSIEIWHPDERLGLESIQSGVKDFLARHLGIKDCEIVVDYDCGLSFEECLQEFKEHAALFLGEKSPKIEFSEDLIKELSNKWNQAPEKVLERLRKASN